MERCINSIISQTYSNFELILVDDGSTDKSGQICDEYALRDSRIIVVHKRNEGVSVARNIALEIVRGDYIAFCDSDDYWSATYLEDFLHGAVDNDADIVIANYRIVDEKGDEVYCSKHRNEIDELSTQSGKWNYIANGIWGNRHGWEVWSRFFKASIIRENSIRFCTTCGNYAEDLAFVLSTLLYSNKICSIDKCGYNYFLRSDSIMRTCGDEIKLSSKNEISLWFYDSYCKIFTMKKYRKRYPILHFLLMSQEYMKIVGTDQYCNLSYEINKIENIDWFKKQTKEIFKCYKGLNECYGKRYTQQILLLTHYCVHRNWIRFKLESAIAYRWFIK